MKLSFRMSILLPVIAAVLVSFIATGLIVYSTFFSEIDTLASQNAWNISYRYGNTVHEEFENAVQMATLVGNAAESFSGRAGGLSRAEVINYLKLLQADRRVLAVWIVWDEDLFDKNNAANIGAEGSTSTGQFAPMVYNEGEAVRIGTRDFASDDGYTEPKKSGRVYISDPSDDRFGNVTARTITVSKTFNINGRVAGVVGVELGMAGITELVRSIKVYDTGYATLIAQNMTNLVHPEDAQLNKRSSAADVLQPYAEKREPAAVTRISAATGLSTLSFFVPTYIPEADYTFYFGTNVAEEEVYAALPKTRNIITIVALLAVALVVVVIVLIVRRLMKQLGGEPQYVIEKVNHIADGDFTTELNVKPDDTASLVFHIQAMVQELRNI
ncbi:MAG: hypothetical protein LBV04_10760, partial [Deferribacteraceae bacterium]|nr:hypothetical protein [Deferribacteraceae bacterium]